MAVRSRLNFGATIGLLRLSAGTCGGGGWFYADSYSLERALRLRGGIIGV
jgi:hypothetical protein